MLVSIVIPSLNEQRGLPATIQALNQLQGNFEVILTDGGSSDRTIELARAAGWRVICAHVGRGRQLNVGAQCATGDILVFLHADTSLPVTAISAIQEILADEAIVGGNFTLRFAGTTRAAKFMTWFYPKLRWFGLAYGDSVFFVRRTVFERLGGYRAIALFEDYDFYQRLKKNGKVVTLRLIAQTSARRFDGNFAYVFSLWIFLQALFWCGVNPDKLASWYRLAR